MLKKNFIAFGIHIVILLFMLIVSLLTIFVEINEIIYKVSFIISIILYFKIGQKFSDSRSLLKNFLTFSSIWIVGLIIWVLDFKPYSLDEYREIIFLEGMSYSFYYSSLSNVDGTSMEDI